MPKNYLLMLALLGAAGLNGPPPVGAQDTEPPPRTFEAEVVYTADLAANVVGGLRRGAVGMGNLDAVLRVDGASLLGWPGSSFLVYGLANHGGAATALTGDAQAVSNIEAPGSVRIYEAWLQQNLTGPRLSLLVGLYDVNSEFDVTGEAGVFLNSSFGIGAEFGSSGLTGPSIFPVTSLGARLQWHPTHRWYIQAALLDGVPGDPDDPAATAVRLSAEDGALWVGEVGYLHHARQDEVSASPVLGRDHVHRGIPWRVALGAWQYTREDPVIGAEERVRGHPGVYVLAEARPPAGQGREGDLGLFLRAGLADDRTNRFGAYTGMGATYGGLLPGRPDDLVGLGLAVAHNGDRYRARARSEGRAVSSAEATLELTYRAGVGSRLVVQPDLQYVFDPGTDPGVENALYLAVRMEVSF